MLETFNFEKTERVLILVLMEDALRGVPQALWAYGLPVLILVLMEDALRERSKDL